MKKFFKPFWEFAKKHKAAFIIVYFAFIVFLGFLIKELYFPGSSGVFPKSEKPKEVKKYEAPLSGVLVEDENLTKRRPFAVVIENHVDSRPQSGLDKASFVFEALAEGGITRFLAFYQENEANEIGPVRSARLYFMDWLSEFDAFFVHCGGNAEALDEIEPYGVLDIDQFFNGKYFWRDNNRWAPHNLYTDTQKLREAAKTNNYDLEHIIEGFIFKSDPKPSERPNSGEVNIDYQGYSFKVKYSYDKKTNSYLRFQGEALHEDKITGNQLVAKNVVVMYIPVSYGKTYKNEIAIRMETTGQGDALVFLDGKMVQATWKKGSVSGKLRFYDADSEEIKFNRGTTWVEVVPLGTNVTHQ